MTHHEIDVFGCTPIADVVPHGIATNEEKPHATAQEFSNGGAFRRRHA